MRSLVFVAELELAETPEQAIAAIEKQTKASQEHERKRVIKLKWPPGLRIACRSHPLQGNLVRVHIEQTQGIHRLS
jgi:hypothetical protein